MSLELMGAGALTCAILWFYRRRRNLTFKITELTQLLELSEEYELVCLVDRTFTAEMDKIIQTFVNTTNKLTCVLHLHSPQHTTSEHLKLRHVHLRTDASLTRGLLIDGSPEHRDEVMFTLFEQLKSHRYIIIDADEPRMSCEKGDHVTTVSDLNRLLGGSVDSP